MRIAYFLPINIEKYSGVLSKVRGQVNAWLNERNEVKIFLITESSTNSILNTQLKELYLRGKVIHVKSRKMGILPLDLIADWLYLSSSFSVTYKAIKEYNPDIVYLRSTLYQPVFKRMYNEFTVVTEINTKIKSEYRLQALNNPKYFLRYSYYRATNYWFEKNISAVVSVTEEIAESFPGIPVCVVPNAIDVFSYPNLECAKQNHLSIGFIGSPGMAWHGIDVLMDLAKKLSNIRFEVIGSKQEDFPDAPANVNFHGFLPKEKYLSILACVTATIGSLAFYRNDLSEACPLKVREYLACCKPVILPYKDTAFELEGYPEWVLQLENREGAILDSADKIEDFLKQCENFQITQKDVAPFIDVKRLEKKRLDFFKSTINSIRD